MNLPQFFADFFGQTSGFKLQELDPPFDFLKNEITCLDYLAQRWSILHVILKGPKRCTEPIVPDQLARDLSITQKNALYNYKSLVTTTNQLSFEQYRRNETSFNDLTPNLLAMTTAGTYQLKPAAHNNLQLISPAANNYTHPVWFLVDGLSFSTTAEFCAIARSHNRGKFIGEETGGAYEGNTSGVQTDIVLPYTQIRVSFGSIQYNMAVRPEKHPGRGIIPDYRVLPTIQDLLNKHDGQLKRALKIVSTAPTP